MWGESLSYWVGLGRVIENGPTDNSDGTIFRMTLHLPLSGVDSVSTKTENTFISATIFGQ